MPEIIRTKERVYRDDYSSDDERSSSYRRPSGSYTTVQRYRVKPNRSLVVAEVDGDRRSTRSERLDIGTKHHHLEVDRRVERVDQIERPRSALEYRDSDRARETKRTIIYERDRDRAREPLSPRSWDRDRDVPYERERETDIRVERRHRERDGEPVEYERVSRETEYYGRPDPPSQTLVIRELPVEVVRREQSVENREVAPPLRRQEDEYYYRRDVREAEPRRDVVARYERREVRPRESVSNDGSDSEVIVRKERRVVRDRSHSPRHKLHIAEGALAGAGAAALLANHREKSGGGSDHRGRKVAAGAAVGALGAELITRARSQLRERSRNRSYSRSRSRSSSRGGHHTKLKTVLALGATALAAAAAGKYISNRNEQRKEEMARGRSRTRSVSRRRYSDDDDDDDAPGGKRDASHRAAAMAKAGAGAAIVGGLVEHFRNKSRGRSKSRLRTGGVAAATGLVGAAAAGIYEARKARQDAQDAAARRSSRSRSRARSLHNDDPAVDPELGMVEYGGAPVYTQPRDLYYDPAAAAAERSRERRASRSRSRVRDIASGALATGAAAIGINKYQKRREEKRAERERREAEHERRRYEDEAPPPEENYYAQGSYDEDYSPSPPRASGGAYFPERANYPPAPVPPAEYTQQTTTEPTHANEYPPHPAYDPTHQAAYDPATYPGVAPPPVGPYGYPAPRDAREGGNVSSKTPFAPQAQPPPPRAMYNMTDEEAGIMTPPTSSASSRAISPTQEQPHNKSVAFAPLSPSSIRTLDKSRRRNSDPSSDRPNTPSRHRRRHRNASHSPSPTSSDEIEVLPDRFDKDGRPLDGSGNVYPKEQEMVGRIVNDFEDVIEGRQSWRALLRDFIDEAGGGGGRR